MTAPVRVEVTSWARARVEVAPVREAVFVVEQGVPPEIELDEWDELSDHAVARCADGTVVGTGRLLPDGHIGRMAVLPAWRGSGAGAAILRALLEQARRRGLRRVVLNAQTQAAGFYARFGFAPTARAPFVEAGIPHLEMARDL